MKEAAGRALALGQEIAQRRAGRFTQQKFAEALGKKPGVVSAWETGKSLPDLASILDVCALLKTTPDDLLIAAGIVKSGDSARALPARPRAAILTAPEGAMEDATFREVWAKVTTVWKYRNTTRQKQWKALVVNVDAFADGAEPDVGEPPEAASGKRRK